MDETDGIEIMYLLDPEYWGWICIRSSEKFHSICNRAYVCKRIIGKVIIVNRDGFQYIKVTKANVRE